jgi:ketosteroid isomerase-like protein
LGTAQTIAGPEQIVELFKGWKQAFPDAVGTITSAVALEVTWNGTHTGAQTTAEGTIPASGKHQETPAAFFFTFAGDKIKASRHYFDSLTLFKQIGAQPS